MDKNVRSTTFDHVIAIFSYFPLSKDSKSDHNIFGII